MNIDWAHKRASELILEHLPFSDWQVTFDRARRHGGLCDFERGVIQLSIPYVRKHGAWEVEQVILHEIAHALAGPHAGHGREWKKQARAIGYDGNATLKDETETDMDQVVGFLGVCATVVVASWITLPAWVAVITSSIVFIALFCGLWSFIGPVPKRFVPPTVNNRKLITDADRHNRRSARRRRKSQARVGPRPC